jgi:long-subunit acyl-CoA synthetase (AMP-forming)
MFTMPACKPVPQDTLTLLYTSDTTGQIEPCG